MCVCWSVPSPSSLRVKGFRHYGNTTAAISLGDVMMAHDDEKDKSTAIMRLQHDDKDSNE